ncbi:MAG: hypothetical protein R3186_06855 [Ruegeria sp.]|nr:hypothetical protein [Ruegeria sp.]
MLGWKIFAHSLRMVFGNIIQVLQITVGPALIATAVIVSLVFVLGVPLDAFDESSGDLPPGFSFGAFFAFTLLMVVVMSIVIFWIAVSWHRFILLEEYPSGIFPPFRMDLILAYLGRVLMLVLIMFVGYIPIAIVFAVLGQSLVAVSIVVTVVYSVFLLISFYRLSIILPAAAIGKPITLGEAWSQTVGAGADIIFLVIVAVLFQLLVQLAFTMLAVIPVLGVLLSVFFGMLILPMVNVSILTTLYGVFVEKRELT